MDPQRSLGDGIVALALAAAFLGYLTLRYLERRHTLAILHQERLAAMERGIPLPELPLDPLFVKTSRPPDTRTALLIGLVLTAFGLGSMLALWLLPGGRPYWAAPLPVAFVGGGLVLAFFSGARTDFGD